MAILLKFVVFLIAPELIEFRKWFSFAFEPITALRWLVWWSQDNELWLKLYLIWEVSEIEFKQFHHVNRLVFKVSWSTKVFLTSLCILIFMTSLQETLYVDFSKIYLLGHFYIAKIRQEDRFLRKSMIWKY